jgi:hypothetical protein
MPYFLACENSSGSTSPELEQLSVVDVVAVCIPSQERWNEEGYFLIQYSTTKNKKDKKA